MELLRFKKRYSLTRNASVIEPVQALGMRFTVDRENHIFRQNFVDYTDVYSSHLETRIRVDQDQLHQQNSPNSRSLNQDQHNDLPVLVSDVTNNQPANHAEMSASDSLYPQGRHHIPESDQSVLIDVSDQTDMIREGSSYNVFSDMWFDLASEPPTDLIMEQTKSWMMDECGDSNGIAPGDDSHSKAEQTCLPSAEPTRGAVPVHRDTNTYIVSRDSTWPRVEYDDFFSPETIPGQNEGGCSSDEVVTSELIPGQNEGGCSSDEVVTSELIPGQNEIFAEPALSSYVDNLLFDDNVGDILQTQPNDQSSSVSREEFDNTSNQDLSDGEDGEDLVFEHPKLTISSPISSNHLTASDLENTTADEMEHSESRFSRCLWRQEKIDEEEQQEDSFSGDVIKEIVPKEMFYIELSAADTNLALDKTDTILTIERKEVIDEKPSNEVKNLAMSPTNTRICDVCHKDIDNTDSVRCQECLVVMREHISQDPAEDDNSKPQAEPELVLERQHNSIFYDMTDSSGSSESLDGVPTSISFYEPDLQLPEEESRPPFITDDEKKFTSTEMKRQVAIWDLISTEKQYVKRLKIMQQIFVYLMMRDLNYSVDQVEKLFPRLDELIELHAKFLQQLMTRQSKNDDKSVDTIGDILLDQFTGKTADKMKSAYGVFCSRHREAVQLYKELLKSDRKFEQLAKYCSNLPVCGKQEISDFILVVTVRLTKYPVIIECIQTNTRDKRDRGLLAQALDACRNVVHTVDQKVYAYEKLVDIQKKMDTKTVTFKGRKFKRQDLNAGNRELLHAGKIGWRSSGGKVYDVLAVVLTDMIVFLQINEQKYTFLTQDKKSSVVPFQNLVVRSDARDSLGIFIISQANAAAAEMHMLVCENKAERQKWIKCLEDAIKATSGNVEHKVWPQTHSVVTLSYKQENYRKIERANRVRQIIEELHHKDKIIKELCDDKNKLMQEVLVLADPNNKSGSITSFSEINSLSESVEIVHAAIQEASRLTDILHETDIKLSRCFSSYGEYQTNTHTSVYVPKRSETFAGFDSSRDSSKLSGLHQKKLVSQQWERESLSPTIHYLNQKDRDRHVFDSPESNQSSQLGGDSHKRIKSNISDISSGQSSLQDLETASVSPLTPLVSSHEQMSSIVYLMQYLNALLILTCKQSTIVESLKAELAEAKDDISKQSADMQNHRSVADQLEEFRTAQENISHEKQEWERVKLKEIQQLENEWREIEQEKQELRIQEADMKRQQEILQKQISMMTRKALRISESFEDNFSEDDVEKLERSKSANQQKPASHIKSASVEFYDTDPLFVDEGVATNFNQHSWETSNWFSVQSDRAGTSLLDPDSSSTSSDEQLDFPFHVLNSEENLGKTNSQSLSPANAGPDNNNTSKLQQESPSTIAPSASSNNVLNSFIVQTSGMKRSNSMNAATRAAWKARNNSIISISDLPQISTFAEPQANALLSAQAEINSRLSPTSYRTPTISQFNNIPADSRTRGPRKRFLERTVYL